MKITVTHTYDENGVKVSEITKLKRAPWVAWYEILAGVLIALIAFSLTVI